MKRLNQIKFFMLAALATVLFACEEVGPTDPSNSEVQTVKQDVKGTLYAYSHGRAFKYPRSDSIIGTLVQFQSSGETDGVDMEWITISHYHVVEFDGDGIITYNKDDFIIHVDEDNTMYGTYDGIGHKENGHFTALWELTVEGGTGNFADASGHFFETVGLKEGTDASPVFEVDLSGTIFSR